MIESRLSNLNRFLEKGAAVPRSAVPTLFTAALGWEAVGDTQKALDCYRKVLAASPNDLNAVDERLRNLVGRHYKNTGLRLQYAELLASLGQNDRALQENLTALEVDPRTAPQVSQYLASRLAATPDDAQLLWSSVQVDLAAGRVPEALDLCGRLADAGQRLPEIEKLLEDMSAGGKETVDTQLLLARVATAQGKAARAIAAVVAALSQDAGERGMAALERLVEAFPAEPRPYQILADFHLREGIDGIVVVGTTGESPTVDWDEHIEAGKKRGGEHIACPDRIYFLNDWRPKPTNVAVPKHPRPLVRFGHRENPATC